jgi:hypothetical protein
MFVKNRRGAKGVDCVSVARLDYKSGTKITSDYISSPCSII